MRRVEWRRSNASFLQMAKAREVTISSHMDLGMVDMSRSAANYFDVLVLAIGDLVTMLSRRRIENPKIWDSIGSL